MLFIMNIPEYALDLIHIHLMKISPVLFCKEEKFRNSSTAPFFYYFQKISENIESSDCTVIEIDRAAFDLSISDIVNEGSNNSMCNK